MTNFISMSLESLIALFISNDLVYESEEYLEAGDELHHKMTDVRQLLPMIKSNNSAAQRMAIYIAAQEGERASIIFDEILNLLQSPLIEIRDDVCDCFAECADSGRQMLALINLLDTDEQQIRLKVMSILSYISVKQLLAAKAYLLNRDDLSRFREGLTILLAEDIMVENHLNVSKLEQVFIFIKAIRQAITPAQLETMVSKSSNIDIIKFYEVYY